MVCNFTGMKKFGQLKAAISQLQIAENFDKKDRWQVNCITFQIQYSEADVDMFF